MGIYVIGLSHHTAPVEVRERVAFAEPIIPETLSKLRDSGLADEAVILSTCNRVELYVATSIEPEEAVIRLRSFLLARSDLLLQDDSGIPLGYFNRKAWQFQPLGRYLGPIEIFPGTYQPQMADLYRNVTPIPLDFGIGYRWRNNESNLLLATRTTEPGITPEVTPSEAPAPRVQRAPARPPADDRPQLRRFWPF